MEKRTERVNMKVRPSWKAAAETKAESLGYSLSRYIEMVVKKDLEETMKETRYVIEEYRDKMGTGTERVFEKAVTKETAIEAAKAEWNTLDDRDKKSYQQDPAGMFRVFEIEITPKQMEQYEDGELDETLEELETREIWSAI